jgi:hypothetical protein
MENQKHLNINKTIMKKAVFIGCLMCFYACTVKQNQQDSVKVENGITYRLADFPLYIDPVYNGSSDPMVCFNSQTGKWYMYYTSRRLTMTGIRGIEQIHGSPIGIAESTDGGATWTYIGNCNIDYKPDPEPTYWAPEIFEFNGRYHMYLSYVPGVFDNWNHPRDIVHLTSKDGINWTTESVLDLNVQKVIDAGVFRLKDGTWRMWYKNETERKDIIWYADSRDLYNWEVKGAVPLGGIEGEGPNVIYWHDKYYLFVDEWKGISVYSSDDATRWTKQDEYLIGGIPLETTADSLNQETPNRRPRYVDGSRGNHADIEVVGDKAFMFYFANIPANMNQRGLAVYVQELIYKPDGTISCDPTAKCYINLNAERERNNSKK